VLSTFDRRLVSIIMGNMDSKPTQSISDYMSVIGRKGGLKVKKLRGKAYFKELRKKGIEKQKSQGLHKPGDK